MSAQPERSPERDAALDALLPNVAFDGWTMKALRMALSSIGEHEDDALHLFPGDAPDMVAAFCDLADRRMEAEAETLGLAARRLPERVREVIALAAAAEPPAQGGGPARVRHPGVARQRTPRRHLYGADGGRDLACGG